MAIRKTAVSTLPENARKYVAEFFVEQKVLGVECYAAQRHTYHPNGSSYSKWGNGLAPSHSVDLMRFGKDEKGREVGDVLRAFCKESPDSFLELYVMERAPNPSAYDD